tara:strand:+ start:8802 stop:9674 length:873 start_codon:yes stop_codon:yes gene_type:complete
MNIFIIGDNGLFGGVLTKFFKKKKIKFIRNSSNRYGGYNDFTKLHKVNFLLDKIKPDIIINLAALTNVDLCEKDKRKANKLNYKIPHNLNNWIKKNKKTYLIHFSTDQVYSRKGPHKENQVKIINNYARTKLKGEKAINLKNSIIFRTNFFGLSNSKKYSFTDWIFRSALKKEKVSFFKNIKFSPLRMNTLCKIINISIKKRYCGLYNLGSRGGLSKANFSLFFLKQLKLNNFDYKIVNFNQNFAAKRSLDMTMNVSKFEKKFNLELPYCKNEILNEIKNYRQLLTKFKK